MKYGDRLGGGRLVPLALSLALGACSAPSATPPQETATESEALHVATIAFGATAAQATSGGAPSFVLESTPDLVLHAKLASDAYDGKTLVVRGTAPGSLVVWSFPHVQKGRSLDVVLRVVGSAATRQHLTGKYAFDVTAPDGTVVARGHTRFASRFANASGGDQ